MNKENEIVFSSTLGNDRWSRLRRRGARVQRVFLRKVAAALPDNEAKVGEALTQDDLRRLLLKAADEVEKSHIRWDKVRY